MTDSHSVEPYGPPIHQAIAKGDLAEMKRLAANAERWLAEHGDIRYALEALKVEIARAEAKHK